MDNLPLFNRPKNIAENFDLDADIVLFNGDTNDLIDTIPNNFVKLIITSPPYNLGKAYENQVSIKQYLREQEETIAKLYRILRSDGNIYWQTGSF
jgi:DNA modification methylase